MGLCLELEPMPLLCPEEGPGPSPAEQTPGVPKPHKQERKHHLGLATPLLPNLPAGLGCHQPSPGCPQLLGMLLPSLQGLHPC